MALTLPQFAEMVAIGSMNDPTKAKLFIWFLHRARKMERVNTSDVNQCFDELHLNKPNVSLILIRLNSRTPRVLLKDSRGYYLEGGERSALDSQYLSLVSDAVVEVEDHVLPEEMVKGTRPYIEKLAHQINGCYEYKFYDGSAVLMRRLLESLLIEAFAKAGFDNEIRGNNGEYKMLADIINTAKSRHYIKLARGSDQICDNVKYVGDRSAHSRTYVSTQKDVQDLIPTFRTIIAELLHLAEIHPK